MPTITFGPSRGSYKADPCQSHSEKDLLEIEDFEEKTLLQLHVGRDMILNLLLVLCILNSFKKSKKVIPSFPLWD